jgi:hypothetical protein
LVRYIYQFGVFVLVCKWNEEQVAAFRCWNVTGI